MNECETKYEDTCHNKLKEFLDLMVNLPFTQHTMNNGLSAQKHVNTNNLH